MLRDDPDWLEYCMRCEETGEKPSLIGFNRWQTSTTNAVTYFHDINPDTKLKKEIAENKSNLNVVCERT